MKLFQIQSPMLRLVGQRLPKAIPLLLAIVICNFILLKLAPGDAADVLAGEAAAGTAEYLAELRLASDLTSRYTCSCGITLSS